MKHYGSSFLCGCAPFTDMLFFSKKLDKFSDKDIVNSSFFAWDEQIQDEKSRWMKYDKSVEWRAIAFATIKPTGGNRIAVAIGSSGQYFEVDSQSLQESLGVINGGVVGLRSSCSVDGAIYATGMGRTVLKRVSAGKWVEFGPGTKASEKDNVIGFEDIAGFSHSELFAVGWQGEIWSHIHGAWKQIDSPTSGNFNALTCAGDGFVYAVGDNGLMVRGQGDQWEVLETERPENLMDVAFYHDEIYVVTDFKILKLSGQRLMPIDNIRRNDVPTTCLFLLECEDGIISMGSKDIFRLHQGVWERVV